MTSTLVPAPTTTDPAPTSNRLPGLLLAVALGGAAVLTVRWVPTVGAPVLAIGAGVLASPLIARSPQLRPGISFAGKTVLQIAVVLLGAQLSLRQVASVGASSLPVMIGTLAICLGATYLLGRALGIERDLRTLIGVGTAICGASAIAAVGPTIKAKSPAIAYAISTIFLFNIAAVLAFPPLGHSLGLSPHAFGLFAGTAVNDTSSVVATATSYGPAAASYAIVVKLTRSLMIIPICLVLAALVRRRESSGEPMTLRRTVGLVPWFLVGFLAFAAINSTGGIPAGVHPGLQTAALSLVSVALAGIGLSTDVGALRRAGGRPLLLGFALWVIVATASLGLAAL